MFEGLFGQLFARSQDHLSQANAFNGIGGNTAIAHIMQAQARRSVLDAHIDAQIQSLRFSRRHTLRIPLIKENVVVIYDTKRQCVIRYVPVLTAQSGSTKVLLHSVKLTRAERIMNEENAIGFQLMGGEGVASQAIIKSTNVGLRRLAKIYVSSGACDDQGAKGSRAG